KLMPDSALSGDGNTLALSTDPPRPANSISVWSLSSRRNVLGRNFAGRRPALSASGNTIAWLSLHQARSIEIATGSALTRTITLPGVPVDVQVSADGSLAGAVIKSGLDRYELVPIEVATGAKGRAVPLGRFPAGDAPWSNPPEIRGATAEPPAAWFGSSGT